jgi:hypothetical protein
MLLTLHLPLTCAVFQGRGSRCDTRVGVSLWLRRAQHPAARHDLNEPQSHLQVYWSIIKNEGSADEEEAHVVRLVASHDGSS